SGVWSYSPNALGSPALGWALTWQSAMSARARTCGRSSRAPRAQLSPIASGRAWRTEYQKASAVCPERVRPEASVMVPETITGSRAPSASKACMIANSAALALRVSNTVSTISMSDQAVRGLAVEADQVVEGDRAETGVGDVRADGSGAAGRADHADREPRAVRRAPFGVVAGGAGQPRALAVELARQRLQAVVRLRDRGGVEGVGLHQVRAGFQVGLVDAADQLRPGEAEQVVVAPEVVAVAGEALAAVAGLVQALALDHGAHGAVEHQDAPRKRFEQGAGAPRVLPGKHGHFPGLSAISEITSKWGGRFSRVTVSLCCSFRPARSTKRRSSRAVNPRFTWP